MRLEEPREEVLEDSEVRSYRAAEDLMARVGVHVLRLRLERGWTQRGLAERVGTDQGRIARIEAGDVNLTLRGLARMAHALGVEAVELVQARGATPEVGRRRVRHVSLEFEWEAEKARSNISRHGITFEEAATVFGDPLSTTIPDPEHSPGEQRHLALGMSDRNRLVVVWFAERRGSIRIIGARLATPRERRDYEEEEE